MKTKDTICKNCYFAEWDDDQETQIGCSLGMLDNARQAGLEVVDVFDDEKAFNIIKNRQCMYCRPKEWGKDKDDPIDYAEKELYLPFQALILTDEKSTKKEVFRSINQLAKQTVKPGYVIVIRYSTSKVKPGVIAKYLKSKKFLLWKVENPIQSICKERQGRRLMDLCLHAKVHTYISTFVAGEYIPLNFYETIRYKILKEFFQFGILTNSKDTKYNEPIHGVVVPQTIFKYYGNTLCEIEKCLKENKASETIWEIQNIITPQSSLQSTGLSTT